jgi:GH24 family phage-related lysozyme (muramidase)
MTTSQPLNPMPTNPPDPQWLAPARQIVAEFEGCRLTAYPDPGSGGDPWTIGYGHTGPDVTPNCTIIQAQADRLLRDDLHRAASEVFRLLPMAQAWTPKRQAALISFTFNVGGRSLEISTLRRRLLAGEDAATVVKTELPRWSKAGKKILEGLVRRRAAEVALFGAGASTPVTTATPPRPPGGAAPEAPPTWPPGMVGPKIRPPLKAGDHHLIANDVDGTCTAWTHDGRRLWRIPCLCRGQGKEAEWNRTGTDTPPGLYRINPKGIHRDYEQDPTAAFTPDRRAYGWYSLDMEGLEGQEGPTSKPYRDGIMLHGGGTACGWPGAWNPRQELHPTLGCIRLRNQDLRDQILPLLNLGTVWISVLQEAA